MTDSEKARARHARYNASEKGRERYQRYLTAHPDRRLATNTRNYAERRLRDHGLL